MARRGSTESNPLPISRLARSLSCLSTSRYNAVDTSRYEATAMSTTTIATMDIASSITRQRSDTDELVARSGVNMAVLESRIRLGIRSVAMGITEGSPAARSRHRGRCE
ncbi:Uncharacterised protein [Mycobacteroides abscessus subsp. abscessus]|nr:Uncharacterised protein [Mycobacteroides abscessus subsp. abscessus]